MININKKKQKKYKTITISVEILILIISIISMILYILKNNFQKNQTSEVSKSQDKIYKFEKNGNNDYNKYNDSTNYDKFDNIEFYNSEDINSENGNNENIDKDINNENINNGDVDEYKDSTNSDKHDKLKLISSYTTKLSTEREKEKNRIHNIKKAAEYLNNTVIDTNQKFSFHETVWAKNKYKKYKYADTLTQNGMDKGLGGGICQVSSTLFVSALKANMKITDRSPHSQKVNYVPIGLDASYETNVKDFCFVNTFSHPVIIKTYFNNNFLTISIFSKNEYDKSKNHNIIIQPAKVIKETKNYVTVDVPIEERYKNQLIQTKHIKSCYKKNN